MRIPTPFKQVKAMSDGWEGPKSKSRLTKKAKKVQYSDYDYETTPADLENHRRQVAENFKEQARSLKQHKRRRQP